MTTTRMELLDNPVWSALTTRHIRFAEVFGALKRYPHEVTPFCSVKYPGAPVSDSSAIPATGAFFAGAFPALPRRLSITETSSVFQMMLSEASNLVAPTQSLVPLSIKEVPEMLELAAAAQQGFVRPKTYRMGRYFGLLENGKLVAMAGERFSLPGYREISGVCTDPEHTGRGYAAQLISHLAHIIQAESEIPFLHVTTTNHRAVALYKRLGFVTRTELPVIFVRHDS